MAKSRYTKTPVPPQDVAERYQLVLEVLSGKTTVTEAARRLGWARNHFQTVMNNGLTGLLNGVTPKAPGPAPKSEREAALEDEVQRLRRENSRLQEQAEQVDRLLDLTSAVVRGRAGRGRRAASTPPKETATKSEDDEPHGAVAQKLEHIERMRALGTTADRAARAAGASASSARRWRTRDGRGERLCNRRGPAPGLAGQGNVAEAEQKLRELNGQIGAAALARCVVGLSRRQAAGVKARMETVMEAERKVAAVRVRILAAGLVRGFDALFALTTAGLRPVLVSGDAAVPYRTHFDVVRHYDELAVAAALAADFEANGAPLILRMDRAKQHGAPRVKEVLERHGVLVLHGPPHCPRFYGQLERQNREHQRWLWAAGVLSPADLPGECQRMKIALNDKLPRRTLGWQTAAQVWDARAELKIDRQSFREEVEQRTRRLKEENKDAGWYVGQAERIAIEATLTQMGLLTREQGGWC